MKKLITAILIIISAAQAGLCSLQTDEINIFNLNEYNFVQEFMGHVFEFQILKHVVKYKNSILSFHLSKGGRGL